MKECSKCGKNAVTFRPYSGEFLCKGCFIKSVETRVRRSITTHKMLKEDDRIALGLSGGKDSVVLLHVMKQIEEKFPKSSLIAITIDEGISGYREESIVIARRNASRLNIPHFVFSFEKIFGYSIDEIMQDKNVKDSGVSACSFCGSLRRRALNQTARELGANKLAVGHNLDDEAQSILLNVLRADTHRLAKLLPNTFAKSKSFVPRIKPLRAIPEREIILFAHFKGMEFHSQQCPYSFNVLRGDIELMLNELEGKRPGTKFSILKFLDDLAPALRGSVRDSDFTQCELCGEPSSDRFCSVCKSLMQLSKK